MKIIHYKNLLVLFLVFWSAVCAYASESSYELVYHEKSSKKKSWYLKSQKGLCITHDVMNADDKQDENYPPTVKISTKKGKLYINDQKMADCHITITAKEGPIACNDVFYPGALLISHKERELTITHLTSSPEKNEAEQGVKNTTLSRQKSNDFTVRVLLDEQMANAPSWKLQSKNGFMIMNPLKPSKKQKIAATEIFVNACKEGWIYINNKPLYTLQAYITPVGESIAFNRNSYHGGLWVVADGTSNKLINCLGIEDYVSCVLTTESWPGWSLEVNKVLAIACRTYVIAMVQNARGAKRSYHIRNTNKHQTYGGGNGQELHRQAVRQTNGLFLAYQSKPITAMFDGCCGGIITQKMYGVDFKKAPYLSRSYACNYCKEYKVRSWKAEYELHDLEKILKKALPGLRRLREVNVTKKDKAGIVQKVQIKGGGYTYYLSGKKIFSLLNDKVKSFSFTISKEGKKIILHGKGYGHHLGLCQWGAKEMVKQGYDYRTVLEFYYPGTQLMRLI